MDDPNIHYPPSPGARSHSASPSHAAAVHRIPHDLINIPSLTMEHNQQIEAIKKALKPRVAITQPSPSPPPPPVPMAMPMSVIRESHDQCQSTITKLTATNAELTARLESRDATIQRLQRELDTAHTTNASHDRSHSQSLVAVTSRMETSERERQSLIGRLSTLESELSQSRSTADTLRATIQRQTDETNSLRQALDANSRERSKLMTSIAAMEAEMEAFALCKSQLSALQARNRELTLACDALKHESIKVGQLTAEIAGLQAQLARQQAEVSEFESSRRDWHNERKSLTSQLTEVRSALVNEELKESALVGEKSAVQRELSDVQQRHARESDERLSRHSAECQQYQQQLSALTAELSHARSELAEARRLNAHLVNPNQELTERLRDDVLVLTKELSVLQRRELEHRLQHSQQAAESDKLRKQVSRLGRIRDSLIARTAALSADWTINRAFCQWRLQSKLSATQSFYEHQREADSAVQTLRFDHQQTLEQSIKEMEHKIESMERKEKERHEEVKEPVAGRSGEEAASVATAAAGGDGAVLVDQLRELISHLQQPMPPVAPVAVVSPPPATPPHLTAASLSLSLFHSDPRLNELLQQPPANPSLLAKSALHTEIEDRGHGQAPRSQPPLTPPPSRSHHHQHLHHRSPRLCELLNTTGSRRSFRHLAQTSPIPPFKV